MRAWVARWVACWLAVAGIWAWEAPTRRAPDPGHRRADLPEVFGVPGEEREEVVGDQPYESGSVTPNAIKIARRVKQAPVSKSVLILGMKSMK